jgi:uncharacterized damage-inducible protein DinB
VSIAENFLPELDLEMTTTRKVLERVPSEKGKWKPHPKSFALGHLAQLIASMPGWITNIAQEFELNLAGGGGYTYEKTESLIKTFDKNVREARAALVAASDAELMKSWSLKHGDRVIFTLPRVAVVRQTINHLVHHRGQMTVYLRLLDIPVPSIYGPTADEGVPGFDSAPA